MRLIYYLICVFVLFFSQNIVLAKELPVIKSEVLAEKSSPLTETYYQNYNKITLTTSNYKLSDKDYWNNYLSEPHYLIENTEYHGFEGVINNQLRRLATRFYNRYYNEYLNQLSQEQIYKLSTEENLEHKWQEREYLNSLDPEKGGPISITRIVGNNHEIFSVGPINLDNSGKFSIDSYGFDVSTSTDLRNRRLNSPDIRSNIDDIDSNKRRFLLGIHFLKQLLKTDDYSITTNARVNIRVDQFSTKNRSGINGFVKFTAFYNHNPWLEVQLKGTARPLVNEYGAELTIQLLAF